MLEKAANIIVNQCLNITNKDNVLILTDKNKANIANYIFNEAKKFSNKVDLVEMQMTKAHGQEPSQDIANKMLNYSVIIAPTTFSITHTEARKRANSRGARIATMPGITEEIMQQSLMADYNKIKLITEHVSKLLEKAKFIHITSKNGTDLKFLIKKERFYLNFGLLHKKGDIGNLPAGELGTSPLEGTVNGTLVIDLMQDKDVVYAKQGTKILIEHSLAKNISDKNCLLAKYFEKVKNANFVAEFGIGTNEKAKLIGSILQDEKVLGTCHIAFGNNTGLGGNIYSQIHLDCIIDKPSIYADTQLIMKDGKLKV